MCRAQNTCQNAYHTFRKKMHVHPCMRAQATVQNLLCHGSYCELILCLLQSFVYQLSSSPPICCLCFWQKTIVSESFWNSDMCRPWLVSVTLGVDYSLVNWEIFEKLPLFIGIFPTAVFISNKDRNNGRQASWSRRRQTMCGGRCVKRGIRAWSMGISIMGSFLFSNRGLRC